MSNTQAERASSSVTLTKSDTTNRMCDNHQVTILKFRLQLRNITHSNSSVPHNDCECELNNLWLNTRNVGLPCSCSSYLYFWQKAVACSSFKFPLWLFKVKSNPASLISSVMSQSCIFLLIIFHLHVWLKAKSQFMLGSQQLWYCNVLGLVIYILAKRLLLQIIYVPTMFSEVGCLNDQASYVPQT